MATAGVGRRAEKEVSFLLGRPVGRQGFVTVHAATCQPAGPRIAPSAVR